MPNTVKWIDWQSSDAIGASASGADARRAWPQLLASLAGLAVAATFLPGPAVWLALFNGTDFDTAAGEGSGVGATAQAAILLAAGLLVWTLLIWGLAVTGAALLGRVPGAPGRLGRVVLRRIAPAAAGRLVAAAVGVSILAGTSACAVPAMASDGAAVGGVSRGVAAAAAPASRSTTGPTATTDQPAAANPRASGAPEVSAVASTAPSGAVILSLDIDWPDAGTSSLSTSTAPTPAPASSPAPAPASGTDATSAGPPASAVQPEATPPATPEFTPPEPSVPEPTKPAPDSEASTPTTTGGTGFTAPTTGDVDPVAPEDGSGTSDGAEYPAETGAVADQPPSAAEPADAVTVMPGDTLWSIAADRLPPDPTDADIDNAWRAWYSVNTQVIGDNPDLILPGQQLLPPDPEMGR